MGEISKIRVDGEVYEVKDAEAREGVLEVAEQAAGAVANEAEARAEAVEAEAEAREADVAKCFRDGGVVEMTEGKAVMVGRDAGIKGTLTFDNELKLNVKHGGKNFEAFRVGDEHVRISTTHDDEDNAYFNMDSGAKIEFGYNNGTKVEFDEREGFSIRFGDSENARLSIGGYEGVTQKQTILDQNDGDDFIKIGYVDDSWEGVHIQGYGSDDFVKIGNVDGTWDGVHIQGNGIGTFIKAGAIDGTWEGVHIQGLGSDDFIKIGSVDDSWEGVHIQGNGSDYVSVGAQIPDGSDIYEGTTIYGLQRVVISQGDPGETQAIVELKEETIELKVHPYAHSRLIIDDAGISVQNGAKKNSILRSATYVILRANADGSFYLDGLAPDFASSDYFNMVEEATTLIDLANNVRMKIIGCKYHKANKISLYFHIPEPLAINGTTYAAGDFALEQRESTHTFDLIRL